MSLAPVGTFDRRDMRLSMSSECSRLPTVARMKIATDGIFLGHARDSHL